MVLRYRLHLENIPLAPSTINVRLAAIRRIAYEAADTGLLSPELVAGIRRVKGIKRFGQPVGNWLTAQQVQSKRLACPPPEQARRLPYGGLRWHTTCLTFLLRQMDKWADCRCVHFNCTVCLFSEFVVLAAASQIGRLTFAQRGGFDVLSGVADQHGVCGDDDSHPAAEVGTLPASQQQGHGEAVEESLRKIDMLGTSQE